MKYFFILIAVIALSLPSSAHAARLWSSGCELQGDGSNPNATDNLEWDVNGTDPGTTKISTSVMRSGLSSCNIVRASTGWGEFVQQFSAAGEAGDVYIRFYLNIGTLPSDATADIVMLEAAGDGDSEGLLVLTSSGTLQWWGDTGSVLDTDATVLSTGTWYRIEINYDQGDTIEVRVDGTTVLSATNDGGTIGDLGLGLCMNSSNPPCTGPDTVATLYFDDIAINDTTGTAQTSWAGTGSIVHMQPSGSAGDTNQSSGTCASVDEVTPDDASTLAVLDVAADKLDCPVEAPQTAGIDPYDTVTLVQVGVREGAFSGTQESWNARIKSISGGTTSSGSTVAHNDTTYGTNGDPDVFPRNYSLTSYTDPTTGVAWTPIGTNSLAHMQIGVNAVDATPDVNLSTIWALVEYVDGSAPTVLTRYSLFSEPMNANTNPISATTNSFTPPDNSLLVVTVGTDAEGVDVQDGMSISGGGLTWTRRVGPTGYTDSGYYGAHEIFTAPVTTGASMQLTISHTGNCGTDCWISAQVVAYTGYNTSSPIGGTASDAALATDGADTITLNATPASDSQVVATRFAVPTGSTDTFATEGAGWTELFDIRSSDFGASGYGGLQTQVRGSSVSTSVAWVDTNDGGVTLGFSSGLAIEIKAASGGGGGGGDKMRARLNAGRIKVQGGRFKLQSN